MPTILPVHGPWSATPLPLKATVSLVARWPASETTWALVRMVALLVDHEAPNRPATVAQRRRAEQSAAR